jgi:hypothetical protein
MTPRYEGEYDTAAKLSSESAVSNDVARGASRSTPARYPAGPGLPPRGELRAMRRAGPLQGEPSGRPGRPTASYAASPPTLELPR